jgi:DNA recombination protein RmuC
VTDILLIVIVVLLVATVALLLMLLKKASQADTSVLASRLDAFEKAQERTERAVREEGAQSRDEQGKAAREQRQELTEAFKTFGDSVVQRMMDVASMQKGQLDAFSGQLTTFAKASGERLDGVRAESATGAKQLREEVVTTLKSISETMVKTMKDLAVAEKVQLEAFSGQIASLTKTSGEKLDGIRTESATGAKQLREEVIAALKGITEATTKTMGELANVQKIQLEAMSSTIGKLSDTNEKKLEAVRVTVEGKLQSMQIDNAVHATYS